MARGDLRRLERKNPLLRLLWQGIVCLPYEHFRRRKTADFVGIWRLSCHVGRVNFSVSQIREFCSFVDLLQLRHAF